MTSTQAEFTLRTLDRNIDPQVDTDRNMQLTVKYTHPKSEQEYSNKGVHDFKVVITDACATGVLTGNVDLPSPDASNINKVDPYTFRFDPANLVADPAKCIPVFYIMQYSDAGTQLLVTFDNLTGIYDFEGSPFIWNVEHELKYTFANGDS